ncbi:iron complex transport system permease protein [Marinospirillum celere]|uniref:Iron complex transport system permease protein n=1 Tax=Marinospirillum celere TaxID=1122252 RepID=A0A1I1FR55_9GAMM|nr:iron ABC transporter permease [Marinospirillum celere]SFC02039.1 iron complex transport system permease protein [Marinospirillum celere]
MQTQSLGKPGPLPKGMLLLLLILGGALLVASQAGALGMGPWQALRGQMSAYDWQLWSAIRLPRLLLALLVGASLAIAGAAMQGMFRNPLADPGLLGVSSGAGLAVALWILLPFHLLLADHWNWAGQMLAACLGGWLACWLVFNLGKGRQTSMLWLLLAGLAINTLAGAFSGLLSYLADDQQLRQMSLWGMGGLGYVQTRELLFGALLMLPGLLLLLHVRKDLDVLQLGDVSAASTGLDADLLKRKVVLGTALAVGGSVALAGIIGFLGLMIPHLLRMIFGPGHRFLLPASALGGASLLLIADALARTLAAPAEIPVGLLTSLIGGPYFLWMLSRGRKKE